MVNFSANGLKNSILASYYFMLKELLVQDKIFVSKGLVQCTGTEDTGWNFLIINFGFLEVMFYRKTFL